MNLKLTSMRSLYVSLLICSIACQAQEVQQGYFTSFDGARIYYEDAGKGKPVVLVHGFMNTGDSWKNTPLYKDLLDNNYRVITLDLRGNGKSDKPHDPQAYANDAEAKDIMGLTKMLKIKKYDIIGYSRGSIITSRVLVLDKHASKAILGGMGADFTDPMWPRRIMFYNALSGKDVPELADMIKHVKDSGLDMTALACQQKEQPSTSPQELAKLNNPVAIICGDQDQDDGSGSALANLIPGSIFIQVPGNHGAAAHSQEFADSALRFLER